MFTREQLATAFNEWLRRYTNNPEQFERDFRVVIRARDQARNGDVPSYGSECVAYLEELIAEQS